MGEQDREKEVEIVYPPAAFADERDREKKTRT